MPTNAAETKHPLYFVSAPIDFTLIGGLSIAVFLAFWFFGPQVGRDSVWTLAAGLAWVVNWPHFSATSYRLYHSRGNIQQYPVTALLIPVMLLGLVGASFASPAGVAPWLVKLFVIWSPYHFSGQTLGITMIYARRAGFPIRPRERFFLSGFIFGTFLSQLAVVEARQGLGSFYGVSYPTLGLPLWVPDLVRVWMWVSGGAFILFVADWCRRNKRLLPPIVLLPAVTQFVWFGLGWKRPGFNEFVPFFHALQYLIIAWVMQVGETLGAKAPTNRRRFVALESLRWAAFNFVGGVILFWALPNLGARFGFTLPFATAVLISAVQIHHFFVDGVIWKLRNPRVASPLLSNVGELIAGPKPATEARAA